MDPYADRPDSDVSKVAEPQGPRTQHGHDHYCKEITWSRR